MSDQIDTLVAELVAAGCGDWDRIERTWPLRRVHALHDHWRRAGPPAHVSLAALAGHKPPAGPPSEDPADLLAQLRAMGVLG